MALVAPASARANPQAWPVTIEIGQRALALPGGVSFSHANPAFVVGTEYVWADGWAGALQQTLRLGWLTSEALDNGLLVATETTYRYAWRFGLFAGIGLGLGYLHGFHPRAIYRRDSAGRYERATDWGRPTGVGSIVQAIGFDLSRQTSLPVAIDLRYQFFLQTPFVGDLPVAPQSILAVGLRFDVWNLL